MTWIWGDKKQDKIPMKFSAKTRKPNMDEKKIGVTLELELKVPVGTDLVQSLRDASVNVEFPEGIELQDVHLAHVEVKK